MKFAVSHGQSLPVWAFGPFVRPNGVNPLLPAQMDTPFAVPPDGPAFADPRHHNLLSHSGAVVCRLVAAKIDGKFWMYWGDESIHLASSADGIAWEPLENEKGTLATVLDPRPDAFDARNLDPGSPAILTDHGILLIYNAESTKLQPGDYVAGSRAAGEALFDPASPGKLLARSPEPILRAELPYEITSSRFPWMRAASRPSRFSHQHCPTRHFTSAPLVAQRCGRPKSIQPRTGLRRRGRQPVGLAPPQRRPA